MKPHCPNCRKEMTTATAARNLFTCEPCREIIQFFGGKAELREADRRFYRSVGIEPAHRTSYAV
jgi:ribosomal protein S27E